MQLSFQTLFSSGDVYLIEVLYPFVTRILQTVLVLTIIILFIITFTVELKAFLMMFLRGIKVKDRNLNACISGDGPGSRLWLHAEISQGTFQTTDASQS